MKQLAILIFSLAFAVGASAQQTIQPVKAEPKNEIGLIGETNFGTTTAYYNGMAGIEFKRYVKPDRALKVFAGLSTLFPDYSVETTYKSGDTLATRQHRGDIQLTIAGIGGEIQRRFYKKVFLHAALEAKSGFGSGYDEIYQTRTVSYPGNIPGGPTLVTEYSEQKISRNSINHFFLEISPRIGAKVVFRHFCIGTDISALAIAYTTQHLENERPYGLFDFNAGRFMQRLFIDYRF